MLIIRSVLLEIFALKRETKEDMPNHHRNEAMQTPEMKFDILFSVFSIIFTSFEGHRIFS